MKRDFLVFFTAHYRRSGRGRRWLRPPGFRCSTLEAVKSGDREVGRS